MTPSSDYWHGYVVGINAAAKLCGDSIVKLESSAQPVERHRTSLECACEIRKIIAKMADIILAVRSGNVKSQAGESISW